MPRDVIHGWLLGVVPRRDSANCGEQERAAAEDVDRGVDDRIEDGEEDVEAVVEDREELVNVGEGDQATGEYLGRLSLVQESSEAEIRFRTWTRGQSRASTQS